MPPKPYPEWYPQKVERIAQLSIELGFSQTESIRRQATAGSSNIITDERIEALQLKTTAELKRFAERYNAVKQQIEDERAADAQAAEARATEERAAEARAAEERVTEPRIKQEEEDNDGGVAIKREPSPPDAEQREFTNVFGSSNLPSSSTEYRHSNRVKAWAAGVEDGSPALDPRVNEEAFDVTQQRSRFQDGYEGDVEESPGARVNNPSNKGKGKAPMARSGSRGDMQKKGSGT